VEQYIGDTGGESKKWVDVRLIYDDMGVCCFLPRNYNKKLESMGIKCCVFNPVSPILSAK